MSDTLSLFTQFPTESIDMDCPICHSPLPEDAAYCPFCGSRNDAVEEFTDYEYEAFISYRHLPRDRAVATKLQRTLEGFAIPKQLRGDDGKRRLGKCFRDEDELPTSSSLSKQIESALKRSRYLVVVCTPQTRESQWVLQEVELFSAYHGRDRALIALAEAEPDDSFPELLLSKLQVDDDGTITKHAVEPMAADFRDLSRAKFNLEAQRIAATLIGCQFDDLRQRMRARRMKLVAGLASGIAAVSIAFSGVTLYQQSQINENYRQIQIRESELLANESADLLAQGNRYQAIQVALAALPKSSTSGDRPFVPAAQMALENALGAYPQESDWHSCYSQTGLADRIFSDGIAFSETGLQATVAQDRSIVITETATDRAVSTINAEEVLGIEHTTSSSIYVALKFAGEKVIAVYDKAIGCFDARTGALEWSIIDDSDVWRKYLPFDRSLAVSSDGQMIAVVECDNGTEAPHAFVISVSDGHIIKSAQLLEESPTKDGSTLNDDAYVDFSPDGKTLAVGSWGSVFQVGIEEATVSQRKLHYDNVRSVKYAGGHLTVASQDVEVVTSDGSVSLEVFDNELNPLWDRTEQFVLRRDKSFTEYWYDLGVCGLWQYYDTDAWQYVALFGDKLLLLDVDTGEEAYRITCESAFLSCDVLESCGTRIFYCTASGVAACRIPFESNNGAGGSLYDWDLGTGSLQCATFTEVGGSVFLSAQNEIPIKRYVYKHASNFDEIDTREFEYSTDDWQASMASESHAIILMKNDVAFLDPSTLEIKATTHLSDIEGANLDNTTSIEHCCSESGDLYYMVELAPEDEKSGKSTGLFRINGNDGSIDGLLNIGGSTTVWQFDAYEYEPNAPKVLFAGYIANAYRVVLYDPSAESTEETDGSDEAKGIWEFQTNEVHGAWYTGERVIAYSAGVPTEGESSWSKSSDDYRFILIDPNTNQVLDCDLSHYALSSEYGVDDNASLSSDGKKFIVACSDGVIRMFDTHTGSLVWEATDVPNSVQLLVMTRSGDVFLQDDFGICMLLSGDTGEVLQASTTPLPRLTAVGTRPDNTMLAAFKEAGLGGRSGMAIISLDQNAFGPLSILYDCWFATYDDGLFMHKNSFLGKCFIAKRMSLDEMIERANTLVEGHELTDAERHTYRVEK